MTLIMANIGTTITPWQIFFQQSAVVDKGMDIKDIKYGKFDTWFGSFMTCVVAAFIIIATAGVFHFNPDQSQGYRDIDSAAKTAAAMPQENRMRAIHLRAPNRTIAMLLGTSKTQ